MDFLTLNRSRRKPLYYNIIKNAKISGNIRKTRWIYNRALKGFFNQVQKGNEDVARNFANQLDSMITVLNEMHGENWDFDLRPRVQNGYFRGFKLYVVIHYPDLHITNSEGDEYDTKNLYVNFQVKNSGMEDDNGNIVYGMYDIKGTTSSRTYEEYFVGYRHSHLGTFKPSHFDDVMVNGEFCLGSDTEIKYQQENLYTEYSPEMFELFLMTLDSVVKWESIEGTPYIRVKNIAIGKQTSQSSLSNERDMDSYFRKLEDYITSMDFDFVFSEYRYKIKQNGKFERFIHSLIVDNLSDNWKTLLVTNVGGKLYGYDSPKIYSETELKLMFTNNDGELPHFYFRSNKVEFNVEPFSGEMPDINKYKVHPNFINHVSTRLEQQLYYKTVRKSTIEKHHQGVNAQQHITQD